MFLLTCGTTCCLRRVSKVRVSRSLSVVVVGGGEGGGTTKEVEVLRWWEGVTKASV